MEKYILGGYPFSCTTLSSLYIPLSVLTVVKISAAPLTCLKWFNHLRYDATGPLACFSRPGRVVVSKTKHLKTKTEARSTQNSKTKHPKLENEAPYLENEAPKTRKRSTQISKTKHPKLENEDP